MSVDLKMKAYAYYREILHEKINMLLKNLDDLKESGKNETKSTAGDKHETALAMLQIEQENKRRQLKEAQEQLSTFDKIDININASKVIAGSLVLTDKGYLFVSIAGGKSIIKDHTVIALSPRSPLGMKMLGAKVNDSIIMNGVVYQIKSIW